MTVVVRRLAGVLGVSMMGSSLCPAQNILEGTPALPNPSGPFAVGATRFVWTDTSRTEIGSSAAEDRRRLVVRVWYPAQDRPDLPRDEYLPFRESYARAGSIGPRTASLLANVTHAARRDAPLPAGSGRYPVIVFSTGNGEMEFMYSAIAEDLASHGYVFAVVPHPGVADVAYSADVVLRRYARLYDPKPGGWEASLPQTLPTNLKRALYDTMYTEAAQYLTADVRFAIDQIGKLDSARGPFRGRLDLQRIVTFGHSYGGNVAVEACARDPRVRACMQLDGGAFGPVRDEGVRKPYLLLRPARVNEGTPRGLAQDQIMGSLRDDGFEVNIEGATHRSFMDAHFISPTSRGDALAPNRVLAITSAYVRAFLRRTFAGGTGVLAVPDRFPEVRLRSLLVSEGQ